MMYITPGSFHWKRSRIATPAPTEDELKRACELINAMSEEQRKAIELWANSRYEDGYDDAANYYEQGQHR
jgi:hypothetical protein